MDIGGLGFGTSSSYSMPSFSQVRSLNQGMLVSLIPSPSSKSSFGLGNSLDVYDAVSQQSFGLLSPGSRSAMQIANISLGIDQSQKFKLEEDEKADTADETKDAPKEAEKPKDEGPKNILDQILKESGYVKPPDNPYVVQTDFFANQYSSNSSLANTGLGSLLNSLG